MSESTLARPAGRTPGSVARVVDRLRVRQAEIFLVTSLVLAVALLVERLDQGWWHHDDGSFAHSAERVLLGELPHRDFADLYTGLLTFLNAGVFAVFGEDMLYLRLPVFVLFLAFVGCFFAIARRLVAPFWAFAATVFAIGWSLPVYPTPVPSWYLLFLSTIGLYAVVRFIETERRRWLLLAGACGGIAIAIKVIGIWYVAAAALALLTRPLVGDGEPRSDTRRPGLYPILVFSSAIVVLALVVAVFGGRPAPSEIVGLLLPVACLCLAVAALGARGLLGSRPTAGATAIRDVAVFLGGVGAPIAVFLVPFLVTGSVGALVDGVVIAPRSRYEFSSLSGPDPLTLLRATPIIALFLVRARVPDKWRKLLDVAAGTLMAFLVASATDGVSYVIIWSTTRALAPFVVVLGAVAILSRRRSDAKPSAPIVVSIVLVGSFATLVQFPFAAPVYFCYAAPLVLLVAIAGLHRLGLDTRFLPALVLVALAVFGVRQLDHQSVLSLGHGYAADPQTAILDEDRASIRVLPGDRGDYARIEELVRQHVHGDRLFAGPDAAEVYFLTGTRNRTRSIMDFLDTSGSTRGGRLTRFLQAESISVVVLNHAPEQSPVLAPATVHQIRSMFGSGEHVGHFEVRWTSPDDST